MKTKKFLTILTLVVLLAVTATTVWAAASPYLIDSFSMADSLDPGVSWWRDTANQNAIAQHSQDEFTGQVSTVYTAADLTVLVYSSAGGPNVTAFITSNSLLLVGPGGGRDVANYAKIAFQAYFSGFTNKHLEAIILTGASPEEINGASYWRSIFRSTPPAPIYANAAFTSAQADRDAVATGYNARQAKALGQSLAWGADGFLGAGSMKAYNPSLLSYSPPDILVSTTTLLTTFDKSFYLLPTADGGLVVYSYYGYILAGGDFGKFLPDVGSIYRPGTPVEEHITFLNQMIAYPQPPVELWNLRSNQDPNYPVMPPECAIVGNTCHYDWWSRDYYIPTHGQPVISNAAIQDALTVQRDALQSIYDQALAQINQGAAIDEAAAAVALSPELASSPYNQEFVSTIPGIVKEIYHEKMGWFGGNITELASTLTEDTKAQMLSDAYGGLDNLIAAARNAELSANDLPGAEQALYLADAAYRLAPDDFTVKQIYAQTLRKNAFMQKSAQVRNYYLTVAQELGNEQVVTDFAKTGVEDTALAFSAAEFSSSFSGIPGASLAAVKIVSLPENGTLKLSDVDVIAGQEIPVAELGGLVFTPAANWNGVTTFLWNGKDGGAYCADDATVTLTIASVNDAPVVSTAFPDVTVDEDAANSTIDVSTGFSDVDIATNGDGLTYAVQNSNPTLVSATVDGALLTLAYQKDQNGAATITVTATDAAGASASDDFTVTVSPLNDAPWANDQAVTAISGQPLVITLEYGDVETAQDKLAFQITSQPQKGTLSGTAPALTYTPNAGYTGPDSFSYTVTDFEGAQATASVQIDVEVMASISGQVYNDANADGTQEPGEGGLTEISVRLLDAGGNEVDKVLTAPDGTYTFTDLPGGAYRVEMGLTGGLVATSLNPVEIALADYQTVTGINFGAVVSADLKVSMDASVEKKTILYTLIVTNDGPADVLAAVLSGQIPDGTAFVSVSTTQGNCSGGKTLTCDFGTLASGSSVTITLKVNRVDTKIAIVNTVTVASSIFDIDLADNSATVTVQ
jgi:uncharacterized repeat protein (TIGR01451 family)